MTTTVTFTDPTGIGPDVTLPVAKVAKDLPDYNNRMDHIPQPDPYYVDLGMQYRLALLEEIRRNHFSDSPLHLALRGHMGTGKDHDLEQFAATLATPYYRIPLTGEVPQELLDAVIEDLLGRIDASREAVVVDQAGAVTWRDGSLGCPQPGMMYSMALVPGYRIILRVGEQTYDYHASDGGYFFLCEGGLAEEPLPSDEGELAPLASPAVEIVEEVAVPTIPTIPAPSSAGLQQLVAQVKEDLASRLSMPIEQIGLVELSSVVWPDGALGCPEPGMAYTQVQVEGFLIRLRAGKQIYPYHGGGGRPPFLCEQAIEDVKPQ